MELPEPGKLNISSIERGQGRRTQLTEFVVRPNQRRPTTTSQDVAPQMRKQDMSSSHQDPSTFSEKQEVQDRVPSQPMQPTDSIEPCQPEPEPIIFTRTLGEHCPMHPHHLCECHTQAQAEAPPLPHHAHTTPAATGSSLRDSDVYLLPTPLGIPNTPPLSQGSSDGETVDIPSPGMAVGYETGEIKPQHCHGHGQQKLMEFEQVGLNRWKSGG